MYPPIQGAPLYRKCGAFRCGTAVTRKGTERLYVVSFRIPITGDPFSLRLFWYDTFTHTLSTLSGQNTDDGLIRVSGKEAHTKKDTPDIA